MNAKQWYERRLHGDGQNKTVHHHFNKHTFFVCGQSLSPNQIMSWLARSLANSLRLDPDDDPLNDVVSPSSSSAPSRPPPPPPPANHDDTQSPEAQSRGVKEDLSELGQTLTRQFWGVASFLAPPPSDHSASAAEEGSPDSDEGIRKEFAEIGGRFRTGVSEISRMASNLITVEEEVEEEEETKEVETGEDEEEEVVERNEELLEYDDGEDYDDGDDPVVIGITHEVLAFARNIAMHPETWLDFPLDEEEDTEDFDMSVAQREHAFAIEQFSPRLTALRIELCPFHMSLGYFWKVYFVLLHSRLNKQDAEVLSTPQVMAARAKWMQELHKQTKPDPGYSARSISHFRDESNSLDEEDDFCHSENMPFWSFSSEPTRDYETEKHPFVSTEMPLIDKSVIEEEQVSKTKVSYSPVGSSSKIQVQDFADEDDDWLKEEGLELQGYETNITMGNEEDVSFSDLENDDDLSLPKKSNTISKDYGASVKKT